VIAPPRLWRRAVPRRAGSCGPGARRPPSRGGRGSGVTCRSWCPRALVPTAIRLRPPARAAWHRDRRRGHAPSAARGPPRCRCRPRDTARCRRASGCPRRLPAGRMPAPGSRLLPGRPAWPFGVSTSMAALRPTRSRAAACRIARVSALCPIATAALEERPAIVISVWCTSAAVSSRSFRAPILARTGARTCSFFWIVLADRPPSPSFSQSPAARPTVQAGLARTLDSRSPCSAVSRSWTTVLVVPETLRRILLPPGRYRGCTARTGSRWTG
jgi:hypothetical protein